MAVQVTPALLKSMFIAYKAHFQKAFTSEAPQWQQVSTLIPSTTDSNLYVWMKELPGFREWVGERVIHALETDGYRLPNRKFEMTVAVLRTMIEDDQYGSFAPLMSEMGLEGGRFPNKLVFQALCEGFIKKCFDGQTFFSATHPVGKTNVSNVEAGSAEPWFLLDTSSALRPIILQERERIDFKAQVNPESDRVFLRDEYVYGADGRLAAGYAFWQRAFGSKQALTEERFVANYKAMTKFKKANGDPAGVKPTVLVVGPDNVDAARKIIKATQIEGTSNVNLDRVTIIESSYITA